MDGQRVNVLEIIRELENAGKIDIILHIAKSKNVGLHELRQLHNSVEASLEEDLRDGLITRQDGLYSLNNDKEPEIPDSLLNLARD